MNPLAEIRRRPWTLLELGLAALLVAWRCAAPTWHPVWLDLFFYLGLYWFFLALAPDADAGAWVALLLMLLLLGIYLKGQVPHMMVAVDILPP